MVKKAFISSYQTWANKNFGVKGGKFRLQFHPIYWVKQLPSRQPGRAHARIRSTRDLSKRVSPLNGKCHRDSHTVLTVLALVSKSSCLVVDLSVILILWF